MSNQKFPSGILFFILRVDEWVEQGYGFLGETKFQGTYEELIGYTNDEYEEFLDTIFSPAGLNIGAITPAEIAISILSEILSILRKKEPYS